MKIYLDNAATTNIHPKVLEKMLPYLKNSAGNPSSIHSFGRKARVAIEESREVIAECINSDSSEIYFTSGGTEANNFIINGIAKTEFNESGRNHIITSAGDHKAVLNTVAELVKDGFTSSQVPLNERFDLDTNKVLFSKDTSLISVVHINNETGTINNIKELVSQNPNIYFHSDAVQSFGKINIDVKDLGVHALSASAHKFHGPKGIGLAYIKSATPMASFIHGGGQERNRRAGTENIASIIGMAEALKIATENLNENFEYVKKLKNYFLTSIEQNGIEGIIHNKSANNSPYTLSITFDPNIYKNDAEAMIMFLDINGIAASSGSACASGTLKPSHVVLTAGYPEEYAKGTLRFSFSTYNTKEEINYTIDVLKKMTKQISK